MPEVSSTTRTTKVKALVGVAIAGVAIALAVVYGSKAQTHTHDQQASPLAVQPMVCWGVCECVCVYIRG